MKNVVLFLTEEKEDTDEEIDYEYLLKIYCSAVKDIKYNERAIKQYIKKKIDLKKRLDALHSSIYA